MKKATTRISFTLLLLGLFAQPLFAQELPLKKILGDKQERTFALYASTLRMINLSGNQEYNEMVSGVEKILIYRLDSATRANKSYLEIEPAYLEEGFEEYAKAFGGKWDMVLLGKEEGINQFVGFLGEKNNIFAFYMRGEIDWEKIPTLINTLRNDELLDLIKL